MPTSSEDRRGSESIEQTALEWNEPSHNFNPGVKVMYEWAKFHLTPEAFLELAESGAH